jgi:hypothetical protein
LEKLQSLVIQVVGLLVAGQYQRLVALTHGERMSAEEIQRSISEYGRNLMTPPDSAYELLDVVRITNPNLEQYSVRMPLWTEQEGRSDLTLELTVKVTGEKLEVKLEDIHVL